jgi:hypothetical protein
MKSEKGEPAFQDIDSILAEKVIRRTKQNIDSSEKDVTREEIPRKKTSWFTTSVYDSAVGSHCFTDPEGYRTDYRS